MQIFDVELRWIEKLQNALRSLLLDQFFIGWHFVDTFGFVILSIAIVWYLIDRKIGIKMFYIFILSGVLNKLFKGVFDLPRPCQMNPLVGLMCPSTPGLPSGAAQSAMLYAGILMIECKKKIYFLWGILFALFLCFSRIYLGVHFFTDVLGGLIIGAGLVLLYWKVFPKFEKSWRLWIFVFPFITLLLLPKLSLPFFWMSLSTGLGIFLYERKEHKKKGRLIQTLIVMAGLIVCMVGFAFYPKFGIPISIFAGLWLSYLGPSATPPISQGGGRNLKSNRTAP